MPDVQHVYVYTHPSNPVAPPPPLLSDLSGTFVVNLWTLPAANNAAGLNINVIYDITFGKMSRRNSGTPSRCNGIAPPSFVFVNT